MEGTPGTDDQEIRWLLEKARQFCAYQERCSSEVRRKLRNIGAGNLQSEQIIQQLEEEGYLSNIRFAKAFSSGKLNNNHWGRIRIRQELYARNIDGVLVDEALQEIDESSYKTILSKLVNRKASDLKETDPAVAKGKIAAYCTGKGFEHDLVWQVIAKTE